MCWLLYPKPLSSRPLFAQSIPTEALYPVIKRSNYGPEKGVMHYQIDPSNGYSR